MIFFFYAFYTIKPFQFFRHLPALARPQTFTGVNPKPISGRACERPLAMSTSSARYGLVWYWYGMGGMGNRMSTTWQPTPRKINGWNIIMEVWKIIFLSKWVICRFYVNLPGCIFVHLQNHVLSFLLQVLHSLKLTFFTLEKNGPKTRKGEISSSNILFFQRWKC